MHQRLPWPAAEIRTDWLEITKPIGIVVARTIQLRRRTRRNCDTASVRHRAVDTWFQSDPAARDFLAAGLDHEMVFSGAERITETVWKIGP